MNGDALAELCRRFGIDDHYDDIWGTWCPVSAAAQRSALAAMGVLEHADADPGAALARLERDALREILPPVQVLIAGERPELALCLPAAAGAFEWRLELEDGGRQRGRLEPQDLALEGEFQGDGQTYVRRRWILDIPLPPGYHRLVLAAPQAAACTLIGAPAHCYRPAWSLAPGARCWGLGVQLYSVRSARNWGIGDLTDLRALLELAARFGADFVGVNPLHALYPDDPRHCSPYSPSSRHFYNPLYLDVEAIPDWAEHPALRQHFAGEVFQGRLRALRSAERIDYPAVAECKLGALRALYQGFRERHLGGDGARARAFRRFLADRGAPLRRHAQYEALRAHLRARDPDLSGWPTWPPQYRDPEAPAVAEFARREAAQVEFHLYLQWQLAEQLEAALAHAAGLGLRLGLYQDLAVGVDSGGADTWRDRRLFALGARIGAPPDDFNLRGQDWGLPPVSPGALRRRAYAPFAALLRDLMRHAGALRIDHVMGLLRLYWVPPGADPGAGLYVGYPLRDLLGVLALESHRNRCLVIGEDLGTVPDAVRSALHAAAVLSCRLLYFARHGDRYLAPHEYPGQALVAMGTHDLPPLAGFWAGSDIRLRFELGLIADPETRDAQLQARARDREALLRALDREGLLPEGQAVDGEAPFGPALNRALHRFLARSPAQLFVVQAEDLLGETRQVNLPGTTDSYPNWSHRLSLDLERWADDPAVAALVEAIAGERGRTPRPAGGPGDATRE
jgi:(1->4)-alpha-D-glucan 1-alpha-D-glucosylmutase